jgi:hypothetical protein
MKLRPLLVGAVLALLAGAAPVTALAVPPADPEQIATRLGLEGLEAYEAGRFGDAYERFAAAEKAAHSPVFFLWMARSQRGLGHLLDARALYDRVVREQLAADAPDKWQAAKQEAESEARELGGRIPALVIAVSGGEDVALMLDGKTITAGRHAVDPGDHVVRALRGGVVVAERRVNVGEAAEEKVVIAIAADEAEPGSIVPGAIVTAVGLAGVVAGAAMGGVALSLASDVKDGCVGDQCLTADEDKAADADLLARVSTAALIAGGVVAATGIVLLVVRPGGGDVVIEALPAGVRVTAAF